MDYNITQKNILYASYNFDYSNNPNQTFDVSTYGNSANGIEGPAHIQTLNFNLVSTLNDRHLNEAHVTYGHETRPRSAINPNAVPDTGMGFFPSFRFGQPFFLGPGASETFYHLDLKDNFSLIVGKHTFKMGGEYLYSNNVQVFDGFALGRYIFGSVTGFLHYATPASQGDGFGPNVQQCSDGTCVSPTSCPREQQARQPASALSAGRGHTGGRDRSAGRLLQHQQPGTCGLRTGHLEGDLSPDPELRSPLGSAVLSQDENHAFGSAVWPIPLRSEVSFDRLSSQSDNRISAARRI